MKRFEILASSDRARPEPAKAWDHVFRRAAALKRFPANLSPGSSGRRLMEAWERWMTAPHPTFLRPAVLDFRLGWLVREWVPGFTLLDLLRTRHKLSARETLALLQGAPVALDHAASHGLLAEIGLDKMFVRFNAGDGSEAPGGLIKQTPDRWLAWSLRVDPLRLSSHLPSAEGQTAQGGVPLPPGLAPAVAAMRHFLRELSGGSLSRPDAPVAAFNGPANLVLTKALRRGGFDTAQALFDALLAASPDDAPQPLERVASLLQGAASICLPGDGTRGEVLTLEPVRGHARPMKLIARREFRLGRSEAQSDLIARFLGDTEQASEMAKRLSRIHARIVCEVDGLRLLDGSGAAPSQNGTWIGAEPIPRDAGIALLGMLAVRLGGHWLATALPAPLPSESAWVPREAQHRWGAVFFAPWAGCAVACETVWLLEEAGFGIDANGAWVWDTEAIDSAPAALRVENGRFVLLNRRLDGVPLSTGGVPVGPGQMAALRDGTPLIAGACEWQIRIG